ncbi:TonB-dependent receptor [uncultured Bacteroides sp.]|uniref:SusC/RagA family TonB-linked outer membrane protein n=1 Tax=uncultured Bacteroides sp. TaxID=162156 RepID=UPI002637121F|nr:TonB-dependent receptor [uncultured Bacteroides sp.]
MKHDFYLKGKFRRITPLIAAGLLTCLNPGIEVFAVTGLSDNLSINQDRKITGRVTDSNGNPLIGVNISIVNQSGGTISDVDGNYFIEASNGDKLKFTYIGYKEQIITVGANNVINVRMLEDSETLDEVVVVGYGVQKKVNLSGSVSAIDGEQISTKASSNIMSALQGELPGVTITRGGGKPGGETSGLQIRGYSSVNSTSTLVLIDGVEGDMNMLNPNDIESISVLKDAASCAIYGARAAAGVILITTKKGVEGKPVVSYNGYVSFLTPGNLPERLPAWEDQFFIDQSRLNAQGNTEWTAEKSSWTGNPNFNYRPLSNGRWDYFGSTNWVDESIKDVTLQQSHSVSVRGGSKSTNYSLSGNFYTKDGLLKYGPDGNERYNIHLNMNTRMNKYVDLGLDFQYQSSTTEQPSVGSETVLSAAFTNRSRQPVYVPEGDESGSIFNGDLVTPMNPVDVMQNGGYDESTLTSYRGKIGLTIKDLVKGLRINLNASRRAGYYSRDILKRTIVWYDRFGNGIRNQLNNPNSLQRERYNDFHDLFEATINYTFELDGKHDFSLLGGTSYENYKKNQMSATATDMNSNDFFTFNAYDTSLASNTVISDNISPWAMMSYFGRINYSFKDRYLLEMNVRYDGSSRLAPERRWRAFPSVSAAWRLSEESWFGLDFVDNLKIRASWGQLGNGAVLGLYDYIPMLNSGNYLSEKFYYQSTLASIDKTWEIIETTNIGLDWGFFNNRLTGSFDYYWKYNNDMLSNLQLPSQIGVGVPKLNVGRLKTWGWDFNIGWKDKIKDFSYQVSFNISDSDNKLLEYDGANVVGEGLVQLLEGYPINTIWGYKTDGFWSSRDEYLQYKEANPGYESFNDGKIDGGDIKYVVQGNPDHVIGVGDATPENPGDLVNLGSDTPHYLYGVNLSAQWKGFDFSMMFQGVGQRSVLVDLGYLIPFSFDSRLPFTIHRDYWTPDNPDAYFPRIYAYKNNDFNWKPSDRWIQNGAYCRLKNITLGYTIPHVSKYLNQLRIYVTGEDVWEHSNMLSIFDPESKNKSSMGNQYPFFRSWSLGFNITF